LLAFTFLFCFVIKPLLNSFSHPSYNNNNFIGKDVSEGAEQKEKNLFYYHFPFSLTFSFVLFPFSPPHDKSERASKQTIKCGEPFFFTQTERQRPFRRSVKRRRKMRIRGR
jgi:hypothetical protein